MLKVKVTINTRVEAILSSAVAFGFYGFFKT